MSAKGLLENGLRILKENGWVKGVYSDEYGQHCSMGALAAAVEDEYSLTDWTAAEQTLEKVICEQYPDRLRNKNRAGSELCLIASFNDDNKTTFADVETVFEKAIVAVDEHVSV